MLLEPRCFQRECKHFRGVRWLGATEGTEVVYCAAFLRGIPEQIAYGDNLHLAPLPGQGNKLVFEKIIEKSI